MIAKLIDKKGFELRIKIKQKTKYVEFPTLLYGEYKFIYQKTKGNILIYKEILKI